MDGWMDDCATFMINAGVESPGAMFMLTRFVLCGRVAGRFPCLGWLAGWLAAVSTSLVRLVGWLIMGLEGRDAVGWLVG
jgi:hypothetical protein